MLNRIRLSPDHFLPFVVQETRRLSPTVCLLRITHAGGATIEPLPVCYSLALADTKSGEQRPYTPINLISDYKADVSYFDILVRQYPGGRMSTFLCEAKPGDAVGVRGPFIKLHIDDVVCKNKRLGLIAGGTGITPMLQIIRFVLTCCSETAMTLLFGNTSEGEQLLTEELEVHVKQSEGRLKVYYVVGPVITAEMISSAMPRPDDQEAMVFLSGPPPMMKALGGGGRKEPLGGVLFELGYTRVHKY